MLKDVHRDDLEVVTLKQGSSLPEVVAGRWKSVVVGAAPSPAGYAAGPLVSRVPVATCARRRETKMSSDISMCPREGRGSGHVCGKITPG